MDEIERVRRDFKPDKVRVLFVGESPPAMGGFFYKVDRLTRFTREAFYKVYGDEVGCGKQFLDFFKAQGCYLDDLSHEPINRKEKRDRDRLQEECIPDFKERLKDYNPVAVVVIVKQIKRHVRKAVEEAGLGAIPVRAVPYPTQWPGASQRYVEALAGVLQYLKSPRAS